MNKVNKPLKIILASTKNFGIGKNNDLPWPRLKNDMKLFKKITCGKNQNALIMGYNTFKSINEKPLPNRMNIVVTSKKNLQQKETENLKFYNTIEEAV